MATVQQGLQAQIRNIEATYGKPMSDWMAIISASGLTKHTDVVTMLKKDYGMTHGAAHRSHWSPGNKPPRRPPPARTATPLPPCTRARRPACAPSMTP